MRARRSLSLWALFSLPLALVLAVVWLTLGDGSQAAEFFRAHRAAHPGLATSFELVSDISNPAMYAVYAWLLIKGLRARDKGLVRLVVVYVLVQALIAFAAVRALKIALGRPRPDAGGLFETMTLDPGKHSLPSGHATEMTGACLPLGLRSGRVLSCLGLGAAVAVLGFSRVYLGWHHPSDVFFGWLLGSVAGAAIHIFSRTRRNA
ncbi:MAG: phosphatase PAP2 family protein [Desulfovibrionaceae bacterium]|nr:phosphatase PAP2 family protein [Desulfovibrionaceae bacterium]